MTLRPAAEVAVEIAETIADIIGGTFARRGRVEAYIDTELTARDEAVASAVREACVAWVRDEFDVEWTVGTSENISMVVGHLEALPLSKILGGAE